MSLFGKEWQVLAERREHESLWQCLLRAREIEDPGQFFSSAELSDLHDPFLFKDMQKAVDRIQSAIAARERIIVYGDYDVDGTSGSAILIHTLRFLTAEVSYRIPHRAKDGYGLHNKYVEELADNGVKLIITVDCGISCAKEVERANELNLDVIITDHHSIPKKKPDAFATLHPDLAPDYPFKHLAGSAVAFKLACALLIASDNADLIARFTDLASLGTVADCVPLTGENRTIVKLGLKQMEDTHWPGLMHMLHNSESVAPYSASTIGFRVGPRINASGRISSPLWALQTLIGTPEEARQKSLKLEELNKERQDLTKQATLEAKAAVDLTQPLLIAAGPWPSGVVGLIAGRIQEEFGKPCFILEDRGETMTGSARSLKGFHAVEALNHVADLLLGYGGHEQAAGFSLKAEHFPEFKRRLEEYSTAKFKEAPLKHKQKIDCELLPGEITLDQIKKIAKFAPFGIGNPQPKFLLKEATIHETRPVGRDGSHLKVTLKHGGELFSGIAFNMAEHEATIQRSQEFLLKLDKNEWNGRVSPQFILVDAA